MEEPRYSQVPQAELEGVAVPQASGCGGDAENRYVVVALKVLVISDLHSDRRVYRGIGESRAWDWLLGIVDYHGHDLLVGLGDRGGAVNEREFYELHRRVRVRTIYGSHDRLGVLAMMYNMLTDSYACAVLGNQ